MKSKLVILVFSFFITACGNRNNDLQKQTRQHNQEIVKVGTLASADLKHKQEIAQAGKIITAKVFSSDLGRIKVEIIADNLNHPWALAMMPDGHLLVTERRGKLWIINSKTGKKTGPVSRLPKVTAGREGGLLDIVCDPDFTSNRTLYFTFAESGKDGIGTAVGSAQLSKGNKPKLTGYKRLFTMNHKTSATQHFGSSILFAPDGTLFITIGDRGEPDRAQDPKDHAGSVIRINTDGTVPADNPFHEGKDALPEIWSIGHRNAQGAAIHPKTGELWTVEHGAQGGDEINRPEAGKNYGWPVISYGRHYSGQKIGVGTSSKGMEQPVHYWDPSIAPGGMDFYKGNLLPEWKNNLFVGALKDQMLVRLTLDGNRVVSEEHLLRGTHGRIRDVRSLPDGALWLLTDESNGKILRITAAN